MINIIGAASFASLYVGAGIAANLGSLAWYRWGDPWVVQNGGQSHRRLASSVKNGYSYGASGELPCEVRCQYLLLIICFLMRKGAVYAIVTSFACMAPNATFLLAFVSRLHGCFSKPTPAHASPLLLHQIIPVPAWMCVSGLLSYDLWKTWTNPEGSREDAAGHVSGILAGLLFWRFRLRGRVTI